MDNNYKPNPLDVDNNLLFNPGEQQPQVQPQQPMPEQPMYQQPQQPIYQQPVQYEQPMQQPVQQPMYQQPMVQQQPIQPQYSVYQQPPQTQTPPIQQQQPQSNPYTDFYGSLNDNMQSNQGNAASNMGYGNFAPQMNVSAPAVTASKSVTPLIVTLICLAVAGIAVACVLFFLNGPKTPLEKAERDSINSFTSTFSSILPFDSNGKMSESGSITITPSKDLLSMLGDIDLSSIGFDYEIISDGKNAYISFGADAMGTAISFSLWQFENQLIAKIPELSDYYILLGDVSDLMNEMTGQYSASVSAASMDTDKLMKELGKVGDKVLDKYFEVTKEAVVNTGKTVSLKGINQTCDMYKIDLNGKLMYELVKTALEAILESKELLNILDDNLYSIMPYGYYNGAKEMLRELLDSLEDTANSPYADEFFSESIGTMNVYISGKNVIKREIFIEDFYASYTSVKDGDKYANGLEIRYDDYWSETNIGFTDSGTEKSGAKTGEISLYFDDGYDEYYLDIDYSDFKVEKNGLISGKLEISIPQAYSSVKLNFSSKGKTQDVSGSVTVLGMKAFDIEITSTTDTGAKIVKPETSGSNVLDINNRRDMEKLEEIIMDALGNLGIEDLLEDFFYYGFDFEDVFDALYYMF